MQSIFCTRYRNFILCNLKLNVRYHSYSFGRKRINSSLFLFFACMPASRQCMNWVISESSSSISVGTAPKCYLALGTVFSICSFNNFVLYCCIKNTVPNMQMPLKIFLRNFHMWGMFLTNPTIKIFYTY